MAEKKFEHGDLSFNITNEHMATISLAHKRPYDGRVNNLINAAREVRKQSLFGNVNLEELARSYPFIPFKYQIENVKAMLNRFEGRGVFGDQVGLGKTVEALMTVHAMFECGAIRNALIVVPSNVEHGWREEIAHKFPEVFELVETDVSDGKKVSADESEDERGEEDKLRRLIGQIKRDNARAAAKAVTNGKNRQKCRLYFITERELKNRQGAIFDSRERKKFIDALREEPSYDKEELDSFERDVNLINPASAGFPLMEYLKRYGWAENGIFDEEYFDEKNPKPIGVLTAPTLYIYERVLEILKKLIKKMETDPRYTRVRNTRGFQDKISMARDIEVEVAERLELYTRYAEEETELAELFDDSAPRIIDLLVIDEVHAFYRNSNEETVGSLFEEEHKGIVEMLADINKKYCVLMSATPLRQNLEDVFDLLYIADKSRFGSTREEAEEYFYGTVCGLQQYKGNYEWSQIPFKLNLMLSDKVKTKAFFGLINNYFTRRRIKDVSLHMKGELEPNSATYNAELMGCIGEICNGVEPAVREKLRKSIISNICEEAALICMQYYNASDSDAIRNEINAIRNWFTGKTTLDPEAMKKLRAAVSRTFSAMSDDPKYTVEQRRRFHSCVDWRRQGKIGIGVRLCAQDGEEIKESTVALIETLQTFSDKLDELFYQDDKLYDLLKENRFVLDRIRAENGLLEKSGSRMKDEEAIQEIYKRLSDIRFRVENDAFLCYVSRNTKRNYRFQIVQELRENIFEGRSVVNVRSDTTSVSNITAKAHNRILVLHQGCQAGINLQQYSMFIFAQMDSQGKYLQEPVDIEQWVGRIHRTGQVKKCAIVTMITTYMDGDAKGLSREFLEWYYGVMADKKGMDLYGNTTPDVALLQPIVTDMVGSYLTEESKKSKTAFENARRLTKLSKPGAELCSLRFSQLLELCYFYDIQTGKENAKDYVVTTIHRLLEKNKEFGKPADSVADN